MSNWISVYTTPIPHRADIVKAVLEEEGLSPIVINKKDSSLKFGYFEVMVEQEEVTQASELINNEIRFE